MKSIARLILVTIVLLSIIVGTAHAKTYYSTGDGVRIRSEPRNADNIIGKLKYGDTVNVVATKGGWCRIEYGDGYGYVTESFLVDTLEDTASPNQTLGLTKQEVSLKKSPKDSSKTIASIPIYTVVTIGASQSGWSCIRYDGTQGFVKTKYLVEKQTGALVFLGSYTITFHQNDSTRTQNIQKAIQKLNGTTVKAGSRFSFFKTVGTKYIPATEFYEDDVMLGGGLSHVASTLSKAINSAQHHGCNIAVKEKHRYAKKTPYAKKGEEAMVSIQERKDFVFKNNNSYPIKIYALKYGDSVLIMLFR